MKAYLDSSVLLRLILGQPGRLAEWKEVSVGVASRLVEVECLRTLDRLKLKENIPHDELALRMEAVFRLMEEVEIVEPTRPILRRASQPFPTSLGTLDAIHLATALVWQEQERSGLVMATHDAALGTGARSCGLRVIGI